jgi:4-hydroxybenzoate polyprenyltransferase
MARPSQAAIEAPPPRGAIGHSTAALLVRSLRPAQWTKNLFVLAGLLFGRRLFDPQSVLLAASAFAIFCALSSAVYLINDVLDREADRVHPLKSARPIASGALKPRVALLAAGLLSAASILAALVFSPVLGIVAGAYLLLLAFYSMWLKHIVIVDVLTIAAGFVLRAVAGAVAVSVPISHWLLVCTTLLALFLALSKRRHELTLLAGGATGHRRILEEYSPYLLDQMVGVVTASTLVAYAIYATSTETAERLGTTRLGLTIPFVLYGIFRYLYLVHQKRGGGSPAEMLLTDRPLLICVGLWAACVVLILYTPMGR